MLHNWPLFNPLPLSRTLSLTELADQIRGFSPTWVWKYFVSSQGLQTLLSVHLFCPVSTQNCFQIFDSLIKLFDGWVSPTIEIVRDWLKVSIHCLIHNCFSECKVIPSQGQSSITELIWFAYSACKSDFLRKNWH